jgi:pyruvate formate lyase activating enzyme
MGFKIKLDSNGSNPDKLKTILESGMVDYVAMDIKSTPQKYQNLMGRPVDIERIKRSVEIIRTSGIEYEFRTTCIPGLHSYEDFNVIAEWIGGSRAYYLQEFRPEITSDKHITHITNQHELNLTTIAASLEGKFEVLSIRS